MTLSQLKGSTFTTRTIGSPNTTDFRVYFENSDNTVISPFHDIPLWADKENGILNIVIEIPRWTNAKLEISKDEPFNPIKQDIKKGKLRFVRNVFPHKGYIWNYGAFPQTWEDPTHAHPDTKCFGDNDPLDVCEIGERVGYVGQVKQVKVLGCMALLDEGETDWKAIVIDVNDPLASKINDIEDVEKYLPGLLRATNEWFRIYKIPDGKPENLFAFNGESKNRKYTLEIIEQCHQQWKKLITNQTPPKTEKYSVTVENTQVSESPFKVDSDSSVYQSVPVNNPLAPAPIDASVDKWFFITSNN